MSWEQYLAILHEARQEIRDQQSAPPSACPHDGEPLLQAPDGGLFCRFDGYRWPEGSC